VTHPAHALGRARPLITQVPAEELPGDPGSLVADVLVFVAKHRDRLLRVVLHLVVAALPLLAISAHVFGVAPMNVTAGLVVVPLALLALVLGLFSPIGVDRLVLTGAAWGVLATLVYDAVRLDTVYLLGWWGDFIPRMGTWIAGVDPAATGLGAVVGYVWRYAGDGGGIGVAFFVLLAATGLRRWGERATVAASVVFAVFPVWTGLVATVALAPRGQQQMFPLTPATVALSLLGHLVFGLVLGLGAARCRRLEEHWPWPSLLDPRVGPAPASARPPRRGAHVIDEHRGPSALVAGPETDAERTDIRVERPVPLCRPVAGSWAGRGRDARGAIAPPSRPVPRPGGRVVRSRPGTGPVRAGPARDPEPWSGPLPTGGRRTGPEQARVPDRAPGPVVGPTSGPIRLDPRSGPVVTARAVPPGGLGPTSGPLRLADVDVTEVDLPGAAWSRPVPTGARGPWSGGAERPRGGSAKAHPGRAVRR
jgi:hypothetical protein